MITLLTGLPGNGKTLFALWYIKQKAEKEQREVYYHNIKDLTLPWSPVDAKDWMSCPKGSIIVIDEAQFVFPKLANGAAKPAHYEQLAVHRHSGFDIYVITQHPSLIDNFVRQLVGQHFHAIRKFGLQRATIYEWSATQPAPQNPASQKSAIPIKWAYPKEVFGYYKSAEVHTVKRSIPAKLILAVLFIVAVLAGGYWSLTRYQDRNKKPNDAPAVVQSSGVGAPAAAAPSLAPGQSAPFDPVADAKHYVAMNTPRVQGLPQTAPKYDDLTKPVRVPVPAMCVQIGDVRRGGLRCKCYSQQGTPLEVEFNQCVSIAQNGFFEDFDPDPRKAAERTDRGVAALAARPDVSVRTGEVAPPPQRESGPVVAMIEAPSSVSSQRSHPDKPLDDGLLPSRTAFAPPPVKSR